MSEYTIGIIVQNQEDNILWYNSNYYIEVSVSENEDINNVIARSLKNTVNKSIHRIIKKYDEVLKYKNKEITMYLVEVGIYNNDFVFMDTEKILTFLYPSPERDYFEKHIVKYKINKNFIYSFFILIMFIVIGMDIPIPFNINLPDNFIWIEITMMILLYIVLVKYIIPRLASHLLRYKINTKALKEILNFILFVLVIINLIKIFVS